MLHGIHRFTHKHNEYSTKGVVSSTQRHTYDKLFVSGEKTWWNKPGFHLSYMEDYPPYPYQRIKNEEGKDTGVVALIAPFYDLTYYRVHASLLGCHMRHKLVLAMNRSECCHLSACLKSI